MKLIVDLGDAGYSQEYAITEHAGRAMLRNDCGAPVTAVTVELDPPECSALDDVAALHDATLQLVQALDARGPVEEFEERRGERHRALAKLRKVLDTLSLGYGHEPYRMHLTIDED